MAVMWAANQAAIMEDQEECLTKKGTRDSEGEASKKSKVWQSVGK